MKTHQKSLNFNKYFSTVNKDPLLRKAGCIYLKDLSRQNLIQTMLVGIKIIECFMTIIPPLSTTFWGSKRWKYQFLNYKHAITVMKRRKNTPKNQMAYIPVYTLQMELM